MQVLGLCRFSYPALGGFQVGHDSTADRIAYLYDPARLEERFRLFETVALPCLMAQTDPDFEMIVLVGAQASSAEQVSSIPLLRKFSVGSQKSKMIRPVIRPVTPMYWKAPFLFTRVWGHNGGEWGTSFLKTSQYFETQ